MAGFHVTILKLFTLKLSAALSLQAENVIALWLHHPRKTECDLSSQKKEIWNVNR